MRILFATDRFPERESSNAPLIFGSKRSNHLQVGYCRVRVGKKTTWNALVELSLKAARPKALELSLGEPDAMRRYPGNSWRSARIDDPSADVEEFQTRRLRLNRAREAQIPWSTSNSI